jgi:hypothetical protein
MAHSDSFQVCGLVYKLMLEHEEQWKPVFSPKIMLKQKDTARLFVNLTESERMVSPKSERFEERSHALQ